MDAEIVNVKKLFSSIKKKKKNLFRTSKKRKKNNYCFGLFSANLPLNDSFSTMKETMTKKKRDSVLKTRKEI